jgi:serine/threonine-protein kinase
MSAKRAECANQGLPRSHAPRLAPHSTALYDGVATQDTVTMIRSAIRRLLGVADEALGGELRAVLKRHDDYQSPGKPSCDWDDAAARDARVDAPARGRPCGAGAATLRRALWASIAATPTPHLSRHCDRRSRLVTFRSVTLSLGGFQLVASLGQGGMCDVLLAVKGAQHVDFTKLVVIKKLRPEFAQDLDFVKMFLDEARIAARLNHPNVIQTLDVGQDGDDFFLAMEYLDGQPWNRIVMQAKEMPLVMRLVALSEVLSGIHYAHELRDFDGTPLNIVHRDVTPHNVFITYDGQLKVMDFGIAKAAGRATETRHGVIKGKITYMAPEQVVATRTIDRRVDIFAVGIMMYEAVVGARLWEGAPSATILKALVAGNYPTSPRKRNENVHEELDRICQKALARDPADRYATAELFREDLDAYVTKHEVRPSNRQIGALVAEAFAKQRARARAILENQIAHIMDARRSVTSISLGIGEPKEPDEIDTASASLSGGTTYAEPAVDSATAVETWSSPRRRRARVRVYALWAVALVSLVLAAFGAWRLERGATMSAREVPKSTITLTLRATPLDTLFQIDGNPPVDNPYVAQVPMDRRAHLVRASAPGFEDSVQQLVFDHDVSVRFALAHVTAAP